MEACRGLLSLLSNTCVVARSLAVTVGRGVGCKYKPCSETKICANPKYRVPDAVDVRWLRCGGNRAERLGEILTERLNGPWNMSGQDSVAVPGKRRGRNRQRG